MKNWNFLEGTVWTVPVVNLPAPALVNIGDVETVSPLVDQTVWVLDRVADGVVVGHGAVNTGGGWSGLEILGTISDDGDVVFSFLPEEGASIDPSTGVEIEPITVGTGTMTKLDGEWTFLMQMSSGNGLGSLTHWAYMVESEPGDLSYRSLPGYAGTSVPDVVDGVPPVAPLGPDSGTPSPDPATIAVWEAFEDTYWYVPPVNLPAQLLLEAGDSADTTTTLPVADQTVWHFETVADGYIVGRVQANVGGGWGEQILVGSIAPDGSVSFSFTPVDGASLGEEGGVEIASIIIGRGAVVEVDGEATFLMQMNSGGQSGSIGHWAYMLQATPDDAAYASLPGYTDVSIPDLFPDAPAAAPSPDATAPTPDLGSIAALGELAGRYFLLAPGSGTVTFLLNGREGMETSALEATVAVAIDTVRDGYIVGTVMVDVGAGFTSYGITGSVTPEGAVLLSASGEDLLFDTLLGTLRETPAGYVLDLQFADGSGLAAAAADFTFHEADASSPVDGLPGLTVGALFGPAGETFVLTAEADAWHGLAFAERVEARGGDDVVFGGKGSDTLLGETGDDRLFGGADADRLIGGAGADTLFGGGGDDRMTGGAGADRLAGRGGDDRMAGGGGRDVLLGGARDDTLQGNAGRDLLVGGDGADSLDGGRGHDRLVAGSGADRVEGGAGDDLIRLGADGEADVVVFASLSPADGGNWGRDTVWGFEHGTDLLDFSGDDAVSGLADLSIGEGPRGVTITTAAGDAVVLLGLAAATLDEGDFVF